MNKKGEVTITGVMIAILLVSCFAGIFTLFLNEMNEQYNTNLQYSTGENVSFMDYNKTQSIRSLAETVKDGSSTIESTNPILAGFDLVGGIFLTGFKVLRGVFDSFSILEDIITTSLTQAGLPYGYNIIHGTIIAISMVVFFMLILAILLKRDRL